MVIFLRMLGYVIVPLTKAAPCCCSRIFLVFFTKYLS